MARGVALQRDIHRLAARLNQAGVGDARDVRTVRSVLESLGTGQLLRLAARGATLRVPHSLQKLAQSLTGDLTGDAPLADIVTRYAPFYDARWEADHVAG